MRFMALMQQGAPMQQVAPPGGTWSSKLIYKTNQPTRLDVAGSKETILLDLKALLLEAGQHVAWHPKRVVKSWEVAPRAAKLLQAYMACMVSILEIL